MLSMFIDKRDNSMILVNMMAWDVKKVVVCGESKSMLVDDDMTREQFNQLFSYRRVVVLADGVQFELDPDQNGLTGVEEFHLFRAYPSVNMVTMYDRRTRETKHVTYSNQTIARHFKTGCWVPVIK